MKILFFNPATAQRKFVPLEAVKGSSVFRRPDYDALRLASMSGNDEFVYFDERVETLPQFEPDLVVVNVELNLAHYVESTVRRQWGDKAKIIACGLYPTLYPGPAARFADAVVGGDITRSWPRIRADAGRRELKKRYAEKTAHHFDTDRRLENRYGFNSLISELRTSYGCGCLAEHRDYCPEMALHGRAVQRWQTAGVTAEVARLKRKIIHVLDDDFLADPAYAQEILARSWRYKRMWIFQTTGQIFARRDMLPGLRECGVRIIYLKHDWLGNNLAGRIGERNFGRQKSREVHMIHSNRMIAGCKLRLGFEGENPFFYHALSKFLNGIKIDLIEVEVCAPLPTTAVFEKLKNAGALGSDPALFDRWMPVVRLASINPQDLYASMELLRDRFYSLDSIVRRNLWVSQKLGLFNTLFFYLISNLSYRVNFLEKIGFPP